MEKSFELTKHVENVIIVGDFNFDFRQLDEEEVVTNNGMVDVVGLLLPPTVFTRAANSKKKARRIDKVVTKVDQLWKATAVQVCGKYNWNGTEPPEMVIEDDVVRTPSDHMCLITDFNI